MAIARVSRGPEREWRKELPTVQLAAEHLDLLLRLDGWEGEIISKLVEGERVKHKLFTYWVEA